jgi:putative OPT family oligopeptide transporter
MNNNDSPKELTIRVLISGVILAVILSAANAYLGLFAGMTVSAAIPAAVIALGIMKFFRGSTIQECNLIGTCASAGESLAAGVIFTLPALLFMGFWTKFEYQWVVIIAGFGGLLGVLFTIPLRRALIVESDLKFPEGVATAKVLDAGRNDPSGIKYIVKAALAGGLFKVGANAMGFWPEAAQGAMRIKGSIAYFGSNLSPALMSVGFIVGLNIAVLIFVGGAANWLLTIPIVATMGEWPVYPEGHTLVGEAMSALDYANQLWSQKTRYIGVGGMLLGGLWTIFSMRKSLVQGVTSGLKAYQDARGADRVEIDRTEKDLPMKWIMILIVGSVVPLFLVYQHFVQQVHISLVMAGVMLVTGFLFSAVAGYMAGLVGSSNNPISGVTISTVLIASLLLFTLMKIGGLTDAEKLIGPAAAVIIGAVVCCAAAIAGDVMQDLKCGRLVRTTPWKQQVMEILGTATAALVIGPVLILLHSAYGFKGMPGASDSALSAPQAGLMASVAKGVFARDLPWMFLFMGMGFAAALIALDSFLQAKKYPFRTPVLAVAIGFYLPFQLSVPILVGGLISLAVKKYHARQKSKQPELDASEQRGLLMASGLITGEALMGIGVAVPIVILKQFDKSMPLWEFAGFGLDDILGIGLLLVVTFWLYQTTVKKVKSV